MQKENSIVPEQTEGAKKDIEHREVAADENDARKLFMIARNRLVDVNRWRAYSEGLSAAFVLFGPDGIAADRTAEKGDYFRIAVPAPGPTESNGYDWVQIEAIEDKSDPDGPYECMAMRVRPTPDPTQKGENVAHFFKDVATSSFVVERDGKTVTAAVYGRNEVPNTETSRVVDKVRNAVVGVGAMLGMANIQWKNLVEGLIKPA